MESYFIMLPIFVSAFIIVVLISFYLERWSIKRAFWGTLGSLILALLATAIFEYGKTVAYLADNKQKENEKNVEIIREGDGDQTETNDEVKKVENIDDTVLEIRTLYNEARENREAYIHKEISTGAVAFYNDEILSFVEVNGEESGEKYTRWYFYQNDELYFAFVFFRLQENRLYFCNNILFRYIDEQGNIYDDSYGVPDCPWETIVKEESRKYLEMSK